MPERHLLVPPQQARTPSDPEHSDSCLLSSEVTCCMSAGPFLDSCSAVQTGEGEQSSCGSCCVELPAQLWNSQGTEHQSSSLSFIHPTCQISVFGDN